MATQDEDYGNLVWDADQGKYVAAGTTDGVHELDADADLDFDDFFELTSKADELIAQPYQAGVSEELTDVEFTSLPEEMQDTYLTWRDGPIVGTTTHPDGTVTHTREHPAPETGEGTPGGVDPESTEDFDRFFILSDQYNAMTGGGELMSAADIAELTELDPEAGALASQYFEENRPRTPQERSDALEVLTDLFHRGGLDPESEEGIAAIHAAFGVGRRGTDSTVFDKFFAWSEGLDRIGWLGELSDEELRGVFDNTFSGAELTEKYGWGEFKESQIHSTLQAFRRLGKAGAIEMMEAWKKQNDVPPDNREHEEGAGGRYVGPMDPYGWEAAVGKTVDRLDNGNSWVYRDGEGNFLGEVPKTQTSEDRMNAVGLDPVDAVASVIAGDADNVEEAIDEAEHDAETPAGAKEGDKDEVEGPGSDATHDAIGITDYDDAIERARTTWVSGSNQRYADKAAETANRTPFTFEPPEIYQRAVRAAEERLQRAGEIDPEVEEFYTKKYEEAGERLMDRSDAFMRSRGMEDSERRGLMLREAGEQTAADIAQYVTIPLMEQADARLEAAIEHAREIGAELVAMEIKMADLMGEYQGRPTMKMSLGKMPYEYQIQVAEGWDYDTGQVDENGDPIMGHIYGTQEWAKMSAEHAQAILVAGFEYTNDQGIQIHVMGQEELAEVDWERSEKTRGGYWKVVLDADGNPMLDQQTGRPIIEHVMGTDGLRKYEIDLRNDLQNRGMDIEEAQFAATMARREKEYEGYTTMIVMPDGTPRSVWVEGAAGMEANRNRLATTLAEMGYTHAESMQIAQQDYEEKVRNGYWVTGPTGQGQIRVTGTESYGEALTRIQSELNIDEDTARQTLDAEIAERERVGYDQVVVIEGPDGRTWTRRVHIGGTQEFALAIQDRADALVREGWTQDSAERHARFGEEMTRLYGGYRMMPDETGQLRMTWVDGSQQHTTNLADMEARLVREGWAAEEAQEMARYVLENSYGAIATVRSTITETKARAYIAGGMTETEAWRRASDDVQKMLPLDGDDEFFNTLQHELAQLELTAMDKRYNAETRVQMLTASMAALAQIGFSLPDFFDWGGDNPLRFDVPELTWENDMRDRLEATGKYTTAQIDAIIGSPANSSYKPAIRNTSGDITWRFDNNDGVWYEYDKDGNRTFNSYNDETREFIELGPTGEPESGQIIDPSVYTQGRGPWSPTNGADPDNPEMGGVGGWVMTKGAGLGEFVLTPLVGADYAAAMPLAAKLSVAAMVVAGAWKAGNAVYDWWAANSERLQESRTSESAQFAEWADTMPEESQYRIDDLFTKYDFNRGPEDTARINNSFQRALNEDNPLEYARDQYDNTLDQYGKHGIKEGQIPQKGDDVEAAEWALVIELLQFDTGSEYATISRLVRSLNDSDFWSIGNISEITNNQQTAMMELWRSMPAIARDEGIDIRVENPSDDELMQMIMDVDQFRGSMNIMSTPQLISSRDALMIDGTLGPAQYLKDEGELTRAQTTMVNQIWDQIGGNPAATLAEKRSRLLGEEWWPEGGRQTLWQGHDIDRTIRGPSSREENQAPDNGSNNSGDTGPGAFNFKSLQPGEIPEPGHEDYEEYLRYIDAFGEDAWGSADDVSSL